MRGPLPGILQASRANVGLLLASSEPSAADMTEDPGSQGESLEEIAGFLSDVEAFRTLGRDQLSRVAAAVTHRAACARARP